MSTKNVNLLWKDFRGIRKLNTINSDTELGADIAHGVRLSKEKSGQNCSIKSSGWFSPFTAIGTTTISQSVGSGLTNITVNKAVFSSKTNLVGNNTTRFTYYEYMDANQQKHQEWRDSSNKEVQLADFGISYAGNPVAGNVLSVVSYFEPTVRLFSANFSNYTNAPDQLIAFTRGDQQINVWLVMDSNATLASPIKIAEFASADDVTDVCMTQWGDRLGMVIAFNENFLGFVYYSADNIIGGIQMGSTGFYYKLILLSGVSVSSPLTNVSRVKPYGSRLAVNGVTTYNSAGNNKREMIYGVWFSEAGNPTNFAETPMSDATETSAFFAETGDYVTQLELYHGLTVFCRNHSYNITGTSQSDYKIGDLAAKGVFGNATFTINGKCGYVDSWSKNIFTLHDNIDGTIGFDEPIGDDIQDYLDNVSDVTVTAVGRRVRLLKYNGQSLVFDVDIGEWTEETFVDKARAASFLNKEYFCNGTGSIFEITDSWNTRAQQTPNENGYYSHYRTNLIWLDSQSSVKSHIYPFAVILEPQTSNDFYVKFTTNRGNSYNARITRAGFKNIATYSNNDNVPTDGSKFVSNDDDLHGRIFFAMSGTELLVTIDRPPFWRYLQIDIYTTSPSQQFNISGIEAKNTFITDEMLDY